MITDEKLSAFISNDLDADEMEEIRAMANADAVLAARLAALAAADEVLSKAYKGLTDASISEDVRNLLRDDNDIAAMESDSASQVSRFKPIRTSYQRMTAIAASVAFIFGVGAGFVLFSDLNSQTAKIAFVSNDNIYNVFETGPSGETVFFNAAETAAVTPILTFKSKEGDYCREAMLSSSNQLYRAAACRSDGTWRVQLMAFVGTAPPSTAYQTASAPADAAFDQMIRGLMAGDALTAEEERALLFRQWESEN